MHLAIIMDGNGRWATQRNQNRQAGHRAGAKTADAIVRAAVQHGIDTLTLYAFSADNWFRPRLEIEALFGLLRRYLMTETDRCVEHQVRINIIGRRDRLSTGLVAQIENSETLTADCSRMHLRIALDYSSRRSIVEAGYRLQAAASDPPEDFLRRLAEVDHSNPPAPPVDLLIRTGGEQRLSDFLLWECAYAELLFLDCMWPDFDEPALAKALEQYSLRQRRFGRIPTATGAHP
ncbi:MAG TPA: polyprenyl diphosphate synthase [Steroidobacteraceae bacterium]|jgi:undecaprenyl diphosphate synthase